jgi:hypothetical protein
MSDVMYDVMSVSRLMSCLMSGTIYFPNIFLIHISHAIQCHIMFHKLSFVPPQIAHSFIQLMLCTCACSFRTKLFSNISPQTAHSFILLMLFTCACSFRTKLFSKVSPQSAHAFVKFPVCTSFLQDIIIFKNAPSIVTSTSIFMGGNIP